ncbi:MAG: ABC transporter permease [Lachnospiraceae bacterium]|nr:ABC transporter permease [Lachnospiraceae bacterium]MBQ6994508.1 ABC transporter permease [Lachnospiraceae bacterium]
MKKGLSKRTVKLLAGLLAFFAMTIIVVHHNPLADQQEEMIKKVVACVLIVIGLAVFYRFYDRLVSLPVELWDSRKLIWKLAKNDFKNRFAGSYLGKVWAFVQPVITVALYWFVFDYVMGARAEALAGTIQIPYVIWLTAGLVPWFFFSEAITGGTMALLEYSYLVKKVVFKISVIPIIKIISASFTHIFFVCFMLVVYVCMGYTPDLYLLQIPYYSLCLFLFVLALVYSTCAMVLFFRDLAQIINIGLQIGMWATPILWDLNTVPPIMQFILKINPMYYIVNGFRSAMFEKTWFWQDFYSTMYFWIVTVVFFGIGALIFRRLKVHFADVL